MDPILDIAREHDWTLIEDGAQAIGAECRGRRALPMGDAGCLSFFLGKNLGVMVGAGMMTTDDHELAAKLAKLRVHGETECYRHQWAGANSRMDNLQAAILQMRLGCLDEWTGQRQINASRYHQHLEPKGLPATPPSPAPRQTRHIFNQFVIRGPRREPR